MTRLLLILILIAHSAVTLFSLRDTSVWSVFPPFRDNFVYQIFSDLVSALGMVFVLCFIEMKRKGRPIWRLGLTWVFALLIGSFAPLIFLLIEKDLFRDV